MTDHNLSREQKVELEKHLAATINEVFNCGAKVSVFNHLSGAKPEHSGIFATADFGHSSVTRDEINALENNGIYWVEHAPHIVQNPDMDSNIENIDIDHLQDAAETRTELIVEFDSEVIEKYIE
jgi:hypothetical protein